MKKYLGCGYCGCVLGCSVDDKRWNCLDCTKKECDFNGRKDLFIPEIIPYQGCCSKCLNDLLDNYEESR